MRGFPCFESDLFSRVLVHSLAPPFALGGDALHTLSGHENLAIGLLELLAAASLQHRLRIDRGVLGVTEALVQVSDPQSSVISSFDLSHSSFAASTPFCWLPMSPPPSRMTHGFPMLYVVDAVAWAEIRPQLRDAIDHPLTRGR